MDKTVQGDATGEKWRATLRGRVASLTAMVCRAPFKYRGGHAGGSAR
ncbi:DUF6380 family protein [Streptomyces sp. NPDC051963]